MTGSWLLLVRLTTLRVVCASKPNVVIIFSEPCPLLSSVLLTALSCLRDLESVDELVLRVWQLQDSDTAEQPQQEPVRSVGRSFGQRTQALRAPFSCDRLLRLLAKLLPAASFSVTR